MSLPAIETPQLPADLDTPCLNHAKYAEYGDDLRRWKGMEKALNEQRLDQTRPLDESKKKIMAWFEGPLSLLKDAMNRRREQMRIFENSEAQKAAALQKEAMQTGEMALVIAPKAEGIATRKVWKWKVVDESKIPDGFWQVNETKIGQFVRDLKDNTNIPGIEVYFEETSIIRS